MRDLKVTKIEGVKIINTTPHPINFKSEKTGKEYQVEPCGFILNAKPVEKRVGEKNGIEFYNTVFEGTPEGIEFFQSVPEDAIVIGSIIAAQAYPRRVAAMTPAKGFERVAPSEKRMNLFKYTIF